MNLDYSTLLKAGGADIIDTRLSNTVIPNYLFQAQVLTNGSSFFLMLLTTNKNRWQYHCITILLLGKN